MADARISVTVRDIPEVAAEMKRLLDERDALRAAVDAAAQIIDDWANDRSDNITLVTLPSRVAAALGATTTPPDVWTAEQVAGLKREVAEFAAEIAPIWPDVYCANGLHSIPEGATCPSCTGATTTQTSDEPAPTFTERLKSATPDMPVGVPEPTQPERWYIHCGCDAHGDHLGCVAQCMDDRSCSGSSRIAASEAEADAATGRPAGPVGVAPQTTEKRVE